MSGYYSKSEKNQVKSLEFLMEKLKSNGERTENVMSLENLINSRDAFNQTPLHVAIEYGK